MKAFHCLSNLFSCLYVGVSCSNSLHFVPWLQGSFTAEYPEINEGRKLNTVFLKKNSLALALYFFLHILLPDIDECSEGSLVCSHTCVNTIGSVYCTCAAGYTLQQDGKTCEGLKVGFSSFYSLGLFPHSATFALTSCFLFFKLLCKADSMKFLINCKQ